MTEATLHHPDTHDEAPGAPYALAAAIEGGALRKAIGRVPEALWKLSEEELRAVARPTSTDHRLRLAFWSEVQKAHESGERAKVASIYGGVCTYQHWWSGILKKPEKLAWLLQPVQDLTSMLKPLVSRIAERYEEIIAMKVIDEAGHPVPALVKLLLEAMRRVEGHLYTEVTPAAETEGLSPAEIDQRLKELEAELGEESG